MNLKNTKNQKVMRGNQFNTLAQSRTSKSIKSPIVIHGEGSDIKDSTSLKARAKRKSITQCLVLHLIDIAKKEKNENLLKSLWNTYHCQQNVVSDNSRLHAHYCKNRICTICSGIRKADIINRYMPVLQRWEQPYFVTLTIKSVPAKRLKPVITNMIKGLQKIIDKQRKRHERKGNIKLTGMRSLECNFNPKRRTYNPHFHLIVPNKATAQLIVSEWLKSSKNRWTNIKGQNYQKVFNNETALVEIIKYGSKIFTEPDLKKKAHGISHYVYVKALYNIINAMKGHRLFASFGFRLPKTQKKQSCSKMSDNYDEWEFNEFVHDWYNKDTGELLSNYQLSPELANLLQNNIDVDLD